MVSTNTPTATSHRNDPSNNNTSNNNLPDNTRYNAPSPLAPLPPKPLSHSGIRKHTSCQPKSQLPHFNHNNRPQHSRRSASWTPEEDEKLRKLVTMHISRPPSITASNTWSRVASQLPRRTGKQCRERYLNQLRPGIKKDPWSPDEERILHDVHARLGNKWVAIAKHLPGRTDNCVKNHWNSMLRKRQRREAAIRVTEQHFSAKLSQLNPPTSRIFNPHVSGLSTPYPQCATPSEMSSHINDFASSGVPSPFTVSSPITPRRDAKLQISSLIVPTGKEMLGWDILDHARSTPPQPHLRASAEKSCAVTPATLCPSPLQQTAAPTAIASPPAPQFNRPVSTTYNNAPASFIDPTSTPGKGFAQASHAMFDHHFSRMSTGVICTPQKIDSGQRSPRFTPSMKQIESNVAPRMFVGAQKKPIAKRIAPRDMPNPLAALADAASSIPLSPVPSDPRQNAVRSTYTASSSQKD